MEQLPNYSSPEQGNCCICLESLLTPGMGCQTLPCDHVMHENCITEMRRRGASRQCPLCRETHAELTPVQVLLDEAALLYMRGEKEKSIHAYSQVHDLDPESGTANFALGHDAFGRGDDLHALELYEAAYRNRSTLVGNDLRKVIYNIGLLHERQGNMDKAEQFYEEARCKGDARAMFNLGMLYEDQGNREKAVKLWQEARHGGQADATFNLGVHYREQGDMERARQFYEEAHRDGSREASLDLGEVHYMQGNIEQAQHIWEQGRNQGSGDCALHLGNLHFEQGNFSRAIALLEEAHLEGVLNGTFGLGAAYGAQGNNEKAKLLFRECVVRGHPKAQRALDFLEQSSPGLGFVKFVAGDRVIVRGLTSEAGQSLNGCQGVVEGYDSRTQRFAVNIDGKNGSKSLRAGNLQGCCEAEAVKIRRGPKVGELVQIYGLQSAKGKLLNGLRGMVVSYDVCTGRRGVQLEGNDDDKIAIKPENLLTSPSSDVDLAECDIQAAIHESISAAATQGPADVNAQVSSALLRSTDADAGVRAVLLKFSRRPRSFREALMQAPELAGCIQALQSHNFSAELECGAKILVRPDHYEATLEAIRLGGWSLFPDHVVTEVDLETVVLGIVEKLPWRESVHPRGSHVLPLGFAASVAKREHKVTVARTFIDVHIPTSLRSESNAAPRTASTTDMDSRKPRNHRGKRS